MNWKTDEEVKEIFNKVLSDPKKRETITRWRNGSRSPKFSEVMEIERLLKLPFEVFLRNSNLKQIETDKQLQLKNLRALIKEDEERKKLIKELK